MFTNDKLTGILNSQNHPLSKYVEAKKMDRAHHQELVYMFCWELTRTIPALYQPLQNQGYWYDLLVCFYQWLC